MKKLQFNAPVILGFFFVSLLSLVLGFLTSGASTTAAFSVYRASLLDPLTYVRFFGHIFGHASLTHFSSNMLLLLVVGPPLEKLYGSKTIALGIMAAALITGILQFVFFPHTILLGASGIVFMLIMLSSFSGAKTGQIPVTLILVALMYLGQEVYSIFFILDSGLHQKNPLKPQGFGGFSDDDGEMFPLFYPYCAVSLNRRQHS